MNYLAVTRLIIYCCCSKNSFHLSTLPACYLYSNLINQISLSGTGKWLFLINNTEWLAVELCLCSTITGAQNTTDQTERQTDKQGI